MFRLDDQFLKDIGLDGLPDEQKKPFLQHIYSELELRVGTRLSDGLSDVQLEEFEKIIDRDQEKIEAWLSEHAPTYMQEEAFGKLQQASGLEANDPRLVAEYTATKWLEVNRSDYRQVVAQVLDELKREITSNRDAIMGGMSDRQPESQPEQNPVQPPQSEINPPINSGAQPSPNPGEMPEFPSR
ncbi:MAG: DUF5663 domain-containing protein [Patescibacteria group bacterium]